MHSRCARRLRDIACDERRRSLEAEVRVSSSCVSDSRLPGFQASQRLRVVGASLVRVRGTVTARRSLYRASRSTTMSRYGHPVWDRDVLSGSTTLVNCCGSSSRDQRCGIGFWRGQRPSVAEYVTGPEATREAPAVGGA